MSAAGYLLEALTPLNVLLALGGVIAGTIIGSLPGLTATMGIAVLVPLTFSMQPASALILMGAIYTGAIYGGAYAAILLNTPGTPSAIATTFDGFPMARRGDGDLAITLACIASVSGGLVGAAFLLLLAPPLANVALAFGPVEYFWLALFGLTLIAALSEGNLLKGLIGGCFGLLLSSIGVAEISADIRFTFGSHTLLGGIETVSALIGLYCIPVLIDLVSTSDRHLRVDDTPRGFRLAEALKISWAGKFNLLRSSVVGTMVGILPGAGGSIAGLVAYSEARRGSKRQKHFGSGEPEGIQATEAANNATVGGGFIPTLVLGIPGTPPDAVILGALLVQGVRTGPNLFTDQGSIVYTFIIGLFLATLLMLPTGLVIGRYAYKTIITIPKAMLVPTVAFMTIIGTYAIRNSVSDVVIMLILGAIGWVMNRAGFSTSPIVLGLILGRIAEQGFVQAWTIGSATGDLASMFFARPISLAILGMIFLSLFFPAIKKRLRKSRREKPAVEPAPTPQSASHVLDTSSTIITVLLIALAGLMLWDTTRMYDADSYVFPRTVAIVMAGLCLAMLVWAMARFGRPARAQPAPGSPARRVWLMAVLFACALVMPFTGFYLAGLATYLALIAVAMYDPWTSIRRWLYPLIGLGVVTGFYLLFAKVLQVPLPQGLWFG